MWHGEGLVVCIARYGDLDVEYSNTLHFAMLKSK